MRLVRDAVVVSSASFEFTINVFFIISTFEWKFALNTVATKKPAVIIDFGCGIGNAAR
jgi:hypothetical protein